MENKNYDINKLPKDLQEKLKKWEGNKPENQQIQILSDVAMMMQELINVADDTKRESKDSLNALGAVLTDAREQLISLNKKESPEAPDYSKPVIAAVDKMRTSLEHAISKIEVKPEVKVPELKIPDINIPEVKIPKIDTSEIKFLLQNEIPKAFKEAIALIPKTEIPEQTDRWDEVLEWLQSIDTASRLKPVVPNQISVVNPDGSSIGSLSGSTAYENRNDTTTDTNLVYLGKALPGTATSSASWQIKRYNKSAGHMSFADDVTTFTKTWDDRSTYGY